MGIVFGIISIGSSISNGGNVTKWKEATKSSNKFQISSVGKDPESQIGQDGDPGLQAKQGEELEGQARSWTRGTGKPAYNNYPDTIPGEARPDIKPKLVRRNKQIEYGAHFKQNLDPGPKGGQTNPNRNKDPDFHPRPKPYWRLKLERLNKNSEWVDTVKKVQVKNKNQCEQKIVNNNNDPERQMFTRGKIGKVLGVELAT